MKLRRAAGLLVLAALLAACASPPRAPGEAWTTGRMSLRIDAVGNKAAQSVSAAFELRGDGRSGELNLNSPLGSRVASARWAPGLAVLQDSAGERRFETLEALSREALGENLPLAALPDWLAGRPWNGAPHQNTDAGFEQLGWQVVLAQRADGLIEVRRAAPPAVLMRVRLEAPAP